jgi:hypothetical protein
MIGLSLFRSFLKNEDGTASIEFLFVFPIIFTIFMASTEAGLMTAKHVMLERSVDIVVRGIQIGAYNTMDHAGLKQRICSESVLTASITECVDSMKIWMQPIDTSTFAMTAPPSYCVDKSEAIDPNWKPPVGTFDQGDEDEIMLLRICLKEDPIFATTLFGAQMTPYGTDGYYAIYTNSVFVNEPS